MSYIVLNNYVKKIKNKVILDHLSYSFDKGKIYGLYGRNGSGKTMLLRAIAGLIKATSGEIIIDGKTLHKEIDFPANTGIIIETLSLNPEFSAFDNLKILSRILNKASDTDIINALQKVGLDPNHSQKVKTYSLGMKQKLNIAQAIFEKQELLLLDEPTNALDAQSVKDIYKLLLGLKEEGKTIIIASHIKEDLEMISDEILYIDHGRIVGKRVENHE